MKITQASFAYPKKPVKLCPICEQALPISEVGLKSHLKAHKLGQEEYHRLFFEYTSPHKQAELRALGFVPVEEKAK